MNKIIKWLESRIDGCRELGKMEREEWAFIQCLKEVRKLSNQGDQPSEPSEEEISFMYELVYNGIVEGVFSTEKKAEEFAKNTGWETYSIFPLGTLLCTDN